MNALARAYASSRRFTFRFVPLLLAAAFTGILHAQAPCTAADLDVTFHFGNYPPSTYLITVVAKNISPNACTLGANSAPHFFAPGKSSPLPVPIRLDGDQLYPEARPPIALDPGQNAHQILRWTIAHANGGLACVQAAALSVTPAGERTQPAELLAPTLLPPICSEVAVESYSLGRTLADYDSPHATSPTLRLSSPRMTYLPGQPFSLNAESGRPSAGVDIRVSTRCPPSFLRQRASTGTTRVQELGNPQISCTRDDASAPDAYLATAFQAITPIQGANLGDASLQLFQLTGSTYDCLIALAASNSLTLHVAH